jgi:predicted RND superfamily exporter protein
MMMKLSEALILRADSQKRVEQLKQRILRSAKVQEGDQSPENPNTLLEELERTLGTLRDLIKRINKTNSATEFEADKTISDVLAERDVLLMKRNAYSQLTDAASVVQTLYSRSEIKFVSTVDVSNMQNQVDELSKQYREIDSRIQAMNWQTELLD